MNILKKIDENVYYIPSKAFLVEVSGALDNIDIETWLNDETEGLYESTECARYDIRTNNKTSTDLTILAGTKCNLRCLYCYSEAGEVPELEIDFDNVKVAVDKVLCNARLKSLLTYNNSLATIKFTGGGEPTCNWNIICATIDYIKKISARDLCYLTIQTNGQGSPEMIDYIINNFDEVVVSCDGFPMIQNLLRPREDGQKSWTRVNKLLQRLNSDNKIKFFLRATVTNDNINFMGDICKYFFNKFSRMKYIHFEPIAAGGRGKRYGTVELKQFHKNLKSCQNEYRNKVGTSMSIYTHKNSCCCDSQSGRSLVLSPTGNLVSCVEEAISDLYGDKSWVIGKLIGNEIIYNNEYINRSFEGAECTNCVAYNFCFGGCPKRIIRDKEGKNISPYGRELCNIQKIIIKEQLKELLSSQPCIDTCAELDKPHIVRYLCI